MEVVPVEKRPCIQAWKQENTWYVQAPASPLASMASGYAGQRGAAGRKGAGKVISDNNRKGCVAVTTLEYGAMSRRSLISAGFLFLCMWTSMSDALLASPPPYSLPKSRNFSPFFFCLVQSNLFDLFLATLQKKSVFTG